MSKKTAVHPRQIDCPYCPARKGEKCYAMTDNLDGFGVSVQVKPPKAIAGIHQARKEAARKAATTA